MESWSCNRLLEDGSTCSQEITSKLKFCPECGARTKPPDTKKPEPEYSWPCPQKLDDGRLCGGQLVAKYRYCPSCGKEVGSPVCRHCLTVLDKVQRFCSECGGRLIDNVSILLHQETVGSVTGYVVNRAEMSSTKSLPVNMQKSKLQELEGQGCEAADTNSGDTLVSIPQLQWKTQQDHQSMPSSGNDHELDEPEYRVMHNQTSASSPVETSLVSAVKRSLSHVTTNAGDLQSPPVKTIKLVETILPNEPPQAENASHPTERTTVQEDGPPNEAITPPEVSLSGEDTTPKGLSPPSEATTLQGMDPPNEGITLEETNAPTDATSPQTASTPSAAAIPQGSSPPTEIMTPHEASQPGSPPIMATRAQEASASNEALTPEEAKLSAKATAPEETNPPIMAATSEEATPATEVALPQEANPTTETRTLHKASPLATPPQDADLATEAETQQEASPPVIATTPKNASPPNEASIHPDAGLQAKVTEPTEESTMRQEKAFSAVPTGNSCMPNMFAPAEQDVVDGEDTSIYYSSKFMQPFERGQGEGNRVAAKTVQVDVDRFTNRSVFSGGYMQNRSGILVPHPSVFGRGASIVGRAIEVPCRKEQFIDSSEEILQQGDTYDMCVGIRREQTKYSHIDYCMSLHQLVDVPQVPARAAPDSPVKSVHDTDEVGPHGKQVNTEAESEEQKNIYTTTPTKRDDTANTAVHSEESPETYMNENRTDEADDANGYEQTRHSRADYDMALQQPVDMPEIPANAGGDPLAKSDYDTCEVGDKAHGEQSRAGVESDGQDRTTVCTPTENAETQRTGLPPEKSPGTCVDGPNAELVEDSRGTQPETPHVPDMVKQIEMKHSQNYATDHKPAVDIERHVPKAPPPQIPHDDNIQEISRSGQGDSEKKNLAGRSNNGSPPESSQAAENQASEEKKEDSYEGPTTRSMTAAANQDAIESRKEKDVTSPEGKEPEANVSCDGPTGKGENMIAYNKNKVEPEDFHRGSGGKKKKKKKGKQDDGEKTNQNVMTVHFYVIVDPEFKFDRKKGHVYIMMDERLSGWKNLEHELTVVRDTADSILMSVEVQIPSRILRHDRPLEYKYCLIREGSKAWMWEHVNGPGPHPIRKLTIEKNSINPGGTMQQYDGIMLRKHDENIPNRVINFVTGSKPSFSDKKTTMSILEEMMPSWEGFHIKKNSSFGSVSTADAALKHVQHLCYCMQKWPVCSSMGYDDRNACFREVLMHHVRERAESFKDGQESPEEASLRMASAMAIVLLIWNYGINFASKVKQRVMFALQIRPNANDQACHDYYGLINHHFPGQQGYLATQLRCFIKSHVSQYNYDFRWLSCIPLLHFLEGASEPYGIPEVMLSPMHMDDRWWGIDKIADTVETFKNALTNKDQLRHILKTFHSLYHVDALFPRTILACLPHHLIQTVIDVGTLPPEAVLAMTYFHFKTGNIKPIYLKDYIPRLREVVVVLRDESLIDPTGKGHAKVVCDVAFGVCVDILDVVVETMMQEQAYGSVDYTSLIEVVYIALDALDAGSGYQRDGSDSSTVSCQKILRERLHHWLDIWLPCCMTMTKHGYTNLVKRDEIDVWSTLLHIEFGQATTYWKTSLIARLQARLTKLQSQDILYIYDRPLKFDTHHQDLTECLSEMAFDAAENQLRSGREFSVQDSSHSRVWCLFSDVFMRIWPKVDKKPSQDEQEILKHILILPAFKRFLQLFNSNRGMIPPTFAECLDVAISLLHKVVQDLVSGDIPVSELRCVVENSLPFIENAQAGNAWNTATVNREVLKEIISWREKELNSLNEHKDRVNTLRNICKNTIGSVDTSDLEEKLAKVDMDLYLSALCDCVKYDPEKKQFDKDRPMVTIFGLSPDIEKKMDSLLELQNSRVFLMVLKDAGKKFAPHKSLNAIGPQLSIQEVFGKVWPKAEEVWRDLSRSVVDGSVCLTLIQDMFRWCYGDEENLREELGYMFANKTDPRIQERQQQIQRYFTISQYVHGAEVILDAKNRLQLTGNFTMLEKIIHATRQSSAQLNSVTKDVVTAGEALKGLEEGHIKCITEYLKAQPLVEWLREHIKRVQELKAFVDLALISAQGMGDLETTKVSCLNAAVSGFAPLIYDLKQTDGFKEFHAKCKAVWRVYNTDQNLPTKLLALHNELEWLKGVNEAQGDVEVNALKQVAAINSRGIYKIEGGKSMHVDDVIRVIVLPEDKATNVMKNEEKNEAKKEGKKRIYSLAELKELHSKLMLVAGKAEKGNEDVEIFVERFNGITGLANTFVSICSAGNILFKTWKANFYCDISRNNNAMIDFGLSNQKLCGSVQDCNVTQQINQVREFIETCLNEWKRYIEEERTEFPELNHYTTEQLVILCEKLAQLANGRDAETERVLALLQDVRPDCNMKHIQAACREAAREQKIEDDHREGRDQLPESHDGDTGDEDPDRFSELVKIYGPQIVARAREMVRNDEEDDLDAIDLKCMEIEDENVVQMDVDIASDQEDVDMVCPQTKQSMGEMTSQFLQQLNEQKSNLREKLDKLWENVHLLSAKGMSDYLSIEHLGRILRHLSENTPINRALPPYLKQGQPNLIVCPEGDVLSTVVSVYMEDVDLPLPTRNEVLLCDENTYPEEVELLVRRAVNDSTGRIFMLVSVHLLKYKVAEHVEKAIEKHTQGQVNYNLVVICSREQQDRSQLVTALDSYRVHTPVRPPLNRLKSYLKKHLRGNNGAVVSACQVDPENSCVRVVRSDRSGTGKSLWMKRKAEKLLKRVKRRGGDHKSVTHSIPLYGKVANINRVLCTLLPLTQNHNRHDPRLYHFDIPHEMEDGVDHLLFNLIILGSLTNPLGYVWRRSSQDLYVIEVLPLLHWEVGANDTHEQDQQSVHHCLELLPTVICHSPQQSLEMLQNAEQPESHDQLMDMEEFTSIHFQRVFQYLSRLDTDADLREVEPRIHEGTPLECLQILLRYCGLEDPSWAELVHFVRFLNVQLASCERSSFCSIGATSDDTLPGFLKFVVRFMIQMSKDFSTRSLNLTEESNTPLPGAAAIPQVAEGIEEELVQFQLKRRWETSPHPYIFFNPDRATMTFLGFVVKKPNFDVVDARSNTVLEEKIMNKRLFDGLLLNKVNLSEDFDLLSREEKIKKLCMVMGNDTPHDPDDKYELTADNVKKIMAIQMRFRCDIPVVIMGETGCGKTELIKFMCRLQCPPDAGIKNMMLMKVHGGTTEVDLIRKVQKAQELATKNQKNHPGIYTVLFLDEVNTTEALGLVKEVLCDHTLNGNPLTTGSSLRLIAACNPYRKHSQEVIEKLEQAGLGYHIKANQTKDKLGRIPMRRLVYRVQPLPQSLLPLVWDFGQLPPNIEQLYIKQIVSKKLATDVFRGVSIHTANIITNVLVEAQKFMRNQQDDCSFVSLRDVKRTMDVMAWFYHQRETLFAIMDEHKAREAKPAISGLLRHNQDESDENGEESPSEDDDHTPSDLARSLILALGVCYHACLQEKREEFREHVCELFEDDLELVLGPNTIENEISLCQDVFLDDIELGPNIARNQALKENVFMMTVCIELRIPLFLVGKPGSSKSLAKTIVRDNMEGPNSRSKLFKKLKEVNMVSYQCSPLSTPDGIINIFGQCAQLQKDKKDLDKFVAVVVLDEIGLAEDSPRMPLKALHPLLEDGCTGDEQEEEDERHKKVGFIGISNWALDPAKMNRGILVQRGPPDLDELEQTARDICSSKTDKTILKDIEPLMRPLATAYTALYDKACEIREYYGLRDFYSLVKMVYGFAKKSKRMPTWHQLQHAILRNFGGLDSVQPLDVFRQYMEGIIRTKVAPMRTDPDNSPAGLIRTSLDRNAVDGESRYLLVLTENYAALQILQQDLDAMRKAIIIFGSSFPKDQDYVVVCRNINRIKVCMETGRTVILLNLESLYESLYDALNQYYTSLGGQRLVDLGLGSHRVKARVHPDFKLVVVAEKDVVYKKFPIPLINRLEKHFVAKLTMLTGQQQRIVGRLTDWTKRLARVPPTHFMGKRSAELTASDIFIGYHHDTCATVILQVCHQKGSEGDEAWAEEVFLMSKEILLQCATPEAIIRARKSQLRADEEGLMDLYFTQQQHDSLIDYLKVHLQNTGAEPAFIQVTTHSHRLSNKDVADVAHAVGLPPKAVHCKGLHAFNTEQEFSKLLRNYFSMPSDTEQILIIQCDSGDKSGELIACTRYIIHEEFNQAQENMQDGVAHMKRHILLIIQLPRVTGGCFIGFQGGMWKSVHLDDLHAQYKQIPPVAALKNQSVSTLVRSAIESNLVSNNPAEREEEDMDVDPAVDDADMEDSVVEDGPMNPTKWKFDYHQLLRSCVHRAAAMLKDKVDMANSTARVHKLLSLLPETPDGEFPLTFGNILKERVYLLLKDKEESKMVGTMAKDWLINEVASVDAINRAGTFRRALWENLEKKITPILAGLIALVDTNNNLSLVTEENWKQGMWLNVFRNLQLTPIVYNDLVSAKRRTELKELPVEMKGLDGTAMSGQLPFSWLLKSYVDDLINQKKKERGGDKDVSHSVGHMLKQSPWWSVLEAALQATDMDTIKDCYLEDFVRMVYKPKTENSLVEYMLVKRTLCTALSILHDHQEQQHLQEDTADPGDRQLGLEQLIPMIHAAESEIHGRLQLFVDVLAQHPAVLEDIQQFLVKETEDPLSSEREIAIDVLAVRRVVRDIQPDRKLLRDPEASSEWLHQVDLTGPLVNTILARSINLNSGQLGSYSGACRRALEGIRSEWYRVSTVKLFVETVCPPGSDQEKHVTRYGPLLFKKLEKANFKKTETMKKVEEFLKSVTKAAAQEYLGDVKVCPGGCNEQMTVSFVMPCSHEICERCLIDQTDADDFSCIECKKEYDKKQKLQKREQSRVQVQKLQVFKQRCNSFLTELVSRMCFAGKTPPEDGVVDMLMGYITKQGTSDQKQNKRPRVNTKAMNIFNDNLDPTPVVRSVLLQLLLRSSLDQVCGHLDSYFEQARTHVTDDKDVVDLAVLYIQCLEDHYHNIGSSATMRDRCASAIDQLKCSQNEMRSDVVTQLSGIAKARFGLSVVVEWLIKVHVRKQAPFDPNMIDRLIRAAQQICTKEEHRGPSLFLMRQLVRRYSLNELHQVAAIFPWIIPEYAQPDETDTAPDYFVVVGPGYNAIRNAMNEGLVDENMEPLTTAIREVGVDQRQHCLNILLAVYREITSKHVLRDPHKQPKHEAIERIQRLCEAVPIIQEQTGLLQALAHNALAKNCAQLEVTPNIGNEDMMLHEVIVHFIVTLTSTGVSELLQPIVNLINNPAAMMNSYLPTMPEDKRVEVHNALLAARRHPGGDANPFLYECPNGHLYMVGQCGRPVATARCRDCGEAIGGQNHHLLQTNQKARVQDTTQPGHSLGSPANRSPMAVPERTMTPACTTLVRLLLHLGLYVGANTKQQEVHQIITPHIPLADVSGFLWQHLRVDLRDISRVTGKGMDDTILLIHLFIHQVSSSRHANRCQDPLLTTRQARSTWETEFAQQMVMPLLNDLDERLRRANDTITKDDRQSNNALRRHVHESEEQNAGVDVANHLEQAPAIWRYRTRVSIEHLTQELGENMATQGEQGQQNLQQYQVLHLFLKKEPLLRVVGHIPYILRFINILREWYHRRIDRSEADDASIRDFFREIKQVAFREKTETLFNHFAAAWAAVHTNLQNHRISGRVLPEEYCNQRITHDTRLSTFLPSRHGRGLCTVALLHYLSSVHNEFMDDFSRITKTPPHPDVSFLDLTPAHLITYDPDHDLLPMVVANCTYSLKVGHGTQIEYNFRSLELQLTERFIKGKARLIFQLEHVSYREELNNAAVFKTLHKKIPQEPLSLTVQEQIKGDCQFMMEISDCLSSLDIAIGFLVSVGGDPDTLLNDFMTKALEMNGGVLTQMARRHCKLCHSQALWLLLSHERDKMAARHKQEPFTAVDTHEYRVELSQEEEGALCRALTHVDLDRFLCELHECIVLHLTIKPDPNDDDMDNKKHLLTDELVAYIENKDGDAIPALSNGILLKDIKVEQCVDTWRVAFNYNETNNSTVRRF